MPKTQLQIDVEAGLMGPGFLKTRFLVDENNDPIMSDDGLSRVVEEEFVPMPDGPFNVFQNVDTGEAYGVYLTPEEVIAKEASDAAFEAVRLAGIRAVEAEEAIKKVVPQLVEAFNELPRLAKAKFASTYDAVELRLSKGRIEDALDIVETAPDQDETKVVKQKIHTILTTLLAKLSSSN